jgi:hypothetical protein
MGHERVGMLPKSYRWRKLVREIASTEGTETDVAEISRKTLENVRSRLRQVESDAGVRAAFTFLIAVSVAPKSRRPYEELKQYGIELPRESSPLAYVKSLRSWVDKNAQSREYAEIAQGAAADAIANWYKKNRTSQEALFDFPKEPLEPWRKASDGSGFCELARLFFGKFTERYLKYFLEREASSVVHNVEERDAFARNLEGHLDKISQHAFETAKITQSFAAGWFNKNAKEGLPKRRMIQSFLSFAFAKMRDELLREATK